METFSALLTICAGNSPVPGEIPTQRPVTRSFDVFFDLRLNKWWVNNRKAGDLRRYRAHYHVIVMTQANFGDTLAGRHLIIMEFHFIGHSADCLQMSLSMYHKLRIRLHFILGYGNHDAIT